MPRRIRFESFEVNLSTGELRRNGEKVKLPEQSFQVLVMLLSKPGEVVLRQEIQKRLWPNDTVVEFENSINAAVKNLRIALQDSADEHRYIETLPRRGYRFIGVVEEKLFPANGSADSDMSETRKSARSSRIRGIVATLLLVLACAVIWFKTRQPTLSSAMTDRALGGSASSKAIAALPLQNPSSNEKEADFLRFALADEIATALSRVPTFSVRPFATTSRYKSPGMDLQQAGHDMGVASVVTGHFLTEGDRLEITLEAVDVETNRTLWRETVNVVASDTIAMREQITTKVRQELIPVLGGSSSTAGRGTHPTSEKAYSLYLQSIAVPHDVAPNKTAIEMLERAVRSDPGYAPAWEALGLRYYFDATYADGADRNLTRSDSADERALALDPDLIFAGANLATNRADEGNIVAAFAQASALVKDRPESAQAHFALAYVQRYAGALDESARECDRALTLDRGNYQFRSCALTFLELDKPRRAMDFVHLDSGSEWAGQPSRIHFLTGRKTGGGPTNYGAGRIRPFVGARSDRSLS